MISERDILRERTMKVRHGLWLAVFIATSLGAYAHQGVTNPAVKERMDVMSSIGDAMKVLGSMAKGAKPFDAAAAQNAAASVAKLAGTTPDVFREPEDDKMSEALPAIWDTFDDFTKKAKAMETAANTAAENITDLASLRSALGQIGQTCKACHSDYRK